MTSLEISPKESVRDGSIAVLATERLVLRAPRPDDAKASLINDRRIAENTALVTAPRASHPPPSSMECALDVVMPR
jgi:hypothetical protein